MTCAVTAGVFWLLLQIPDAPENTEGALMSAQQRIHHDDQGAYASDASCLLSAAARLRGRPIGPVGRYDHRSASATGHLLEALGHAVVRDADSIPPEVMRVALRLARATCARPRSAAAEVEDGDHDRHSSSSRWAATPPTGAEPGSRWAPFTSSIRLGRMG